MAGAKKYQDKDTKIVIEMWGNGHSATEIGNAIGKSMQSVRQYIHRNREKYGLEKKEGGRHRPISEFDKQWHGAIPFGHWMITKPWKKAS